MGVAATSLSGKEVQPQLTGCLELDTEVLVAPGVPQAGMSRACRASGSDIQAGGT